MGKLHVSSCLLRLRADCPAGRLHCHAVLLALGRMGCCNPTDVASFTLPPLCEVSQNSDTFSASASTASPNLQVQMFSQAFISCPQAQHYTRVSLTPSILTILLVIFHYACLKGLQSEVPFCLHDQLRKLSAYIWCLAPLQHESAA